MLKRVRIEIEFDWPGSHTLADCIRLVLNQMQATPVWEDQAGTGLLNYVCHDDSLRVVAAKEVQS